MDTPTLVPCHTWTSWRDHAPAAAQVALDRALQGHVSNPDDPAFWWARPALVGEPPWSPAVWGTRPNWDLLAAGGGDATRTFALVGLLPQENIAVSGSPGNVVLSPPLLRFNHLNSYQTCNWFSFLEGYRPCYLVLGPEPLRSAQLSFDTQATGYHLPSIELIAALWYQRLHQTVSLGQKLFTSDVRLLEDRLSDPPPFKENTRYLQLWYQHTCVAWCSVARGIQHVASRIQDAQPNCFLLATRTIPEKTEIP